MDWTIFEVDHPVILVDDRSPVSVWERMAPAPVLLTGLCVQPGTSVAEVAATDGFLGVLAAVAGADSYVVAAAGHDDTVRRNAEVNESGLQLVDSVPDGVDVLVAHSRDALPDIAAHRPVVLLTQGVADLPGYDTAGVVGAEIVIGDPAIPGAPHLLIPKERTEQVVGWLDEAVHAFGARTRTRWADRSTHTALRLAEYYRGEAERGAVEAQEQVQRAYSQMRDALDELRAVRTSRSWRLTRPLRKFHRL